MKSCPNFCARAHPARPSTRSFWSIAVYNIIIQVTMRYRPLSLHSLIVSPRYISIGSFASTFTAIAHAHTEVRFQAPPRMDANTDSWNNATRFLLLLVDCANPSIVDVTFICAAAKDQYTFPESQWLATFEPSPMQCSQLAHWVATNFSE